MNKKQTTNLSNILFISFFILQLLAYFLYVPCDTYEELIKSNGHVYKLEKIAFFTLVLGAFLAMSGSNKSVFRVIFVAVTYSTLNELTGLNNYLYSFEYPVFWSMIALTSWYSYAKYKK